MTIKPSDPATVEQLRAATDQILNLISCQSGANPILINAARERLEVILTGRVPQPFTRPQVA